MNKNILIIGASGQIGSLLCEYFSKTPHKVFTLNKMGDTLFPLILSSSDSVDKIDSESMFVAQFSRILVKYSIHHIIHCASPRGSLKTLEFYDRKELERTNYTLSKYLVESIALKQLQTTITFLSTSAMFTSIDKNLIIDETTEHNPSSIYGEIKSKTVKFLDLSGIDLGLNFNSLILFNQESPRRNKGFLFNHLAHQMNDFKSGKIDKIEVDNKEYSADWSDARDLPQLVDLILTNELKGNFIVASGIIHSIQELLLKSAKVLAFNLEGDKIFSRNFSTKKTFCLVGDSSKAKSVGWVGSRPIEHTLADFVRKLDGNYAK